MLIRRHLLLATLAVGALACDEPRPQPTAELTRPAPQTAAQVEPAEAAVPAEEPFEDPCPGSGGCRKHGTCEFVDDDCKATQQAHCDESEHCRTRGECVLTDGACQATADSCDGWQHCPLPGACPFEKGRCVMTDEACAAGTDCKQVGACAAVEGVCAPTKKAHCASARICKQESKCQLDDTGSVPVCAVLDPTSRDAMLQRGKEQLRERYNLPDPTKLTKP